MMDRAITCFLDLVLLSALAFCMGYLIGSNSVLEVLVAFIYFPITAYAMQQSLGQRVMVLKIEVCNSQINTCLLLILRSILKIYGMAFLFIPVIPLWRSGNTRKSLLDIVCRTRVVPNV